MSFLLPENCETCGEKCISRTISNRYTDIEETEYKCGARYHQYRSHQKKTIEYICPKSPEGKKRDDRLDEINQAVAKALNSVKATWQECEKIPHRMEMDKLSAGYPKGVWQYLKAQKPKV